MRGAHDPVSDAEVLEVVRLAMAEYRNIDYTLERAADAEDAIAGLVRTGEPGRFCYAALAMSAKHKCF